jgi:hypothetical protein
VDPFVRPGDRSSGLISGIQRIIDGRLPLGAPDERIQSFNYRLCLTDVPSNRVPIERPADYGESEYELLFRLYEAGHRPGFTTNAMPNRKTDSNNRGAMSLDFVGGNHSVSDKWNYGDASYEQRADIVTAHRRYIAGLIWTLQNHPRIPRESRDEWSRWGLASDEFADNGHWPHQLYIREARRMIGALVMTEHHVKQAPGYLVPDSVGMGSYSLDSHVVRRIVHEGRIRNEGAFYVFWGRPYPISDRALTPRRDEVLNRSRTWMLPHCAVCCKSGWTDA